MARKKTTKKPAAKATKKKATKKTVARKKKPVARKKKAVARKKPTVAKKRKPVAAKKKPTVAKKQKPAAARSAAHDLLELLRQRRARRAREKSLPDETGTVARDQRRKAYASETEAVRQHEHFMDSNVRRIQGHYSAQTRHKQGRRDAQQLATRPIYD